MTIKHEGILTGDLKAALFRCNTCGDNTFYQGPNPGVAAKLVADIHEKVTGRTHDIVVKGYGRGDPWPETDFLPGTQFYTLWINRDSPLFRDV